MADVTTLGTRAVREPLLEVDGVSVNYGAIKALKGVSLSVGQGEVVALIGANGAGKTSTLRAVSGMLVPAAGRIRLRGEDTTAGSVEQVGAQGAWPTRPKAAAFSPT